jgi:basic amino acid/polyamine antiporter, APA family
MATLARRLGSFDVTLIVVGSIIGSGIFRTPSVVAQRVHSPAFILGAWIAGGIIALFGAFVLGELAARRSDGFGVYTYLRDAFHPVVGFAYGWTSLLVAFTGGIAASAILFAGYFEPLTGIHVQPALLAVIVIAAMTLVTCVGVRGSANVQNILAVLKIACVVGLIVAGVVAHPAAHPALPLAFLGTGNALSDVGIALIPVLFAYNGAVVANFMGIETKSPARSLPTGLWCGVLVVMALYVSANAVCLRMLGAAGLAATPTPIADVFGLVAGPLGDRLAALAVVITTLGFISNRMLTAPRLYHAMAKDGLFFKAAAWIDPRTRVPTIAIAVQGCIAIVIALIGSYDRVLNAVVSTAYVFTGLFAVAIFVFRARDKRAGAAPFKGFTIPWHPVSTILVIATSWAIAADTYARFPLDGLIASAILLSAVPVYFIWLSADRISNRPNVSDGS